jgi:hypothetical protein
MPPDALTAVTVHWLFAVSSTDERTLTFSLTVVVNPPLTAVPKLQVAVTV